MSKKSNMLMKWTDLVPGDILRYNPEFIEKVRKTQNLYDDEKAQFIDNKDKNLTIRSITFYDDSDRYNAGYMCIEFREYNIWAWSINCEKCVARSDIYVFGNIPMFITYKLLKD